MKLKPIAGCGGHNMTHFELKCKLKELIGSRAFCSKTKAGAYAMVSQEIAAEVFQIMTNNFKYFEVERLRHNTTFTVLIERHENVNYS